MSNSDFLKLLAENGLSHTDRAVALIWYTRDVSSDWNVPSLCNEMEQAGYSRQNPSRLKRMLASDARVLKGKDGGYKVNPLQLAKIEQAFSKYAKGVSSAFYEATEIDAALQSVSEDLARSYKQTKLDLLDSSRVSWAGTAHEIRQLLSSLLHTLAPDDVVASQSWFVLQPNTSRPTQSQRARYIFQEKGEGTSERAMVERLDSLDKVVEDFARLTYSRASDAAHNFKPHQEAKRIMRYAEAIIFDLVCG